MNITQGILINQIAETENINVATVRQIFKSTETIISGYLSSVPPSEELNIRVFSGITVMRKHMKTKHYSKGALQDIVSQEHVNVKAHFSKYYTGQINQKLFGKKP